MECKVKDCKRNQEYSCEGYCRECYKEISRIRQKNLLEDYNDNEIDN